MLPAMARMKCSMSARTASSEQPLIRVWRPTYDGLNIAKHRGKSKRVSAPPADSPRDDQKGQAFFHSHVQCKCKTACECEKRLPKTGSSVIPLRGPSTLSPAAQKPNSAHLRERRRDRRSSLRRKRKARQPPRTSELALEMYTLVGAGVTGIRLGTASAENRGRARIAIRRTFHPADAQPSKS